MGIRRTPASLMNLVKRLTLCTPAVPQGTPAITATAAVSVGRCMTDYLMTRVTRPVATYRVLESALPLQDNFQVTYEKHQQYVNPGSWLAIPNALYGKGIRRVAYRTSTLPYVEPLSTLEGDWVVDITRHLDVVSRHNHLGAIFDVRWPV